MTKMRTVTEKKQVLQRLRRSSNIDAACQNEGICRSTYYRWLNDVKIHGENSLKNKSRKPLNSPSKTTNSITKQILKLALSGKYRFANQIRRELGRRGLTVSLNTVLKTLKQKGLYGYFMIDEKNGRPIFSRIIPKTWAS